jgi:hypothetical protein
MRTILAGLAIALLTIAGAPLGRGSAAHPRFTDPATVRREAMRDVERRLHLAKPPPGARRMSEAPRGSHLGGPGLTIDSKDFLDQDRIWAIPGSPAQTLEWIETHPPAGLPIKVRSSFSSGGQTISTEIGFEWKPLPRRITSRYLYFAVTSGPEGGTLLRVDSQGVWVFPHPATEVIPASARLLAVLRDPERGLSTKQRVADVHEVRRLASLIDRLPATQPVGAQECGPGLPEGSTAVILVFSDAAGRVVAEARQQVPEGWCTPMELTIEGKPQHLLAGGGRLLQKLLPPLSHTD